MNRPNQALQRTAPRVRRLRTRPVIPIILAQDPMTPQELEEFWRLTQKSWEPRPYIQTLLEGGPLDLGIHVLMVAAAVTAVVLAWRRGHFGGALFVSFLPFALGATSLWLRVVGLSVRQQSPMGYHGNVIRELSEASRPFIAGAIATLILLVGVTSITRVRRSPKVA
jgi:hypothetical protein